MTRVVHLPARADEPIACDMSSARDTPEERLAEYGDLFERALLGRERREDAVVLAFRVDARKQVEDLARREHACCPFLDYRVEVTGDQVIWTITNTVQGERRAAVDAILDALHALPERAGSDLAGHLDRLAERGVEVVRAGTARAVRRQRHEAPSSAPVKAGALGVCTCPAGASSARLR